jgi:hypothetical protein
VDAKLRTLAPLFDRMEVRTRNGEKIVTIAEGVSYSELQTAGPSQQLLITFYFHRYQGNAPTPFDYETVIGLHFPPDRYTISHDRVIIVSNPYSRPLPSDETDTLSAKILANAFESVKAKAND